MNQLAIVKYLAQGLMQEQVASIVGCTPGYISQLLKQQDIQEQIDYYKKQYNENEKKEQEEEKGWTDLRTRVREYLTDHLPYAEYKDVLRLQEILDKRNEKKVPTQQTNIQQNVTILQVPAAAVPEFVVNSNNEVIGIGDQSLAPMTAQGVKELFNKHKEAAEAKKAEEAKKKAQIEKAEIIIDLDRMEKA